MANPYNSNQWDQSQMYYSQQNAPMEPEFSSFGQYPDAGHQQRQPQQVPQQVPQQPQQLSHYSQSYQFNANPQASSSLQGAFQAHSRSSSYGAQDVSSQPTMSFNQGMAYRPPNGQGQVTNQPPYRNTPQPFRFGMSTVDTSGTGGGLPSGGLPSVTTSPDALHPGFMQDGRSVIYPNTLGVPGPSSAKRQRSEPQEEMGFQDEEPGFDAKDNQKAKPIRACARCKSLKVKCEVKNEGDPCKRCMNGGHDCFIPGRKVRRVPPKREFLISQIQSQAKQIERLMKQLESVGATVKKEDDQLSESDNHPSPVLASSSLPQQTLFGANSSQPEEPTDAATKKAIEDWIAKTRENMQELSFICVSSGGVPESYIVDEDPEAPFSSDDDEFVEASDRFDDLEIGEGDERIGLAVEDPNGEASLHPEDNNSRRIRHRSSASSMGTSKSATGSRKKGSGDHEKPVNLPVAASPFGLFGQMALKTRRSQSAAPSEQGEDEEPTSGIANEDFFRPTPAPEIVKQPTSPSHQVPAILAKGLITPAEAEKLFNIYYTEMNLSVSLLDPVLYDAQRTFWRSPFLFTVICTIASKFYSERPELYQQAMQHAQIAAGNALVNGTKNVEMVAAYMLMSLYPIPVKRWEQQRSWLYLGLAIRTATDLNLHLPITAKPKNENHAREMLNRTRIWLNCFNVDRSTGSQYGKPPIISNFDYTANHSENWWQSSPQNLKHFDIHICAYNAELRLMTNFIGEIYSDRHHPTGLNKEVDFERIATKTDDDLQRLKQKWFTILETTDLTDPQNRFRTGLLSLAYSYARLIALSYGFQHAFGKNDGQDENPFLLRCLNAASDVVHAVVDELCCPELRHYFRHGPDAQSVFVTFASAFLVKLLQPKFAQYLTRNQRIEIRALVQKVVDVLASPDVAVDDRHGPKLYSRFLRNLLAKPLARIDHSSEGTPQPSRPKPRPTKTPSGGEKIESQPSSADPYTTTFNHPSPATSGSLSPPTAESMTDFNSFRPVGGIDPFAPDAPIMSLYDEAMNPSGDFNMGDFFQPELPFDQDIIRSFHDLTDPSGWQDVQMPVGFNFMTQFQQNMGIDMRAGIVNTEMDPKYNFLTQTP